MPAFMLKITREGRKTIYLIIQTSLHFSTSCIKLHTVPEKYDFDSLLWIRDNALHQNLLSKNHRYKVRTTGYQVNLVLFSACGFHFFKYAYSLCFHILHDTDGNDDKYADKQQVFGAKLSIYRRQMLFCYWCDQNYVNIFTFAFKQRCTQVTVIRIIDLQIFDL